MGKMKSWYLIICAACFIAGISAVIWIYSFARETNEPKTVFTTVTVFDTVLTTVTIFDTVAVIDTAVIKEPVTTVASCSDPETNYAMCAFVIVLCIMVAVIFFRCCI